MKFGITLPNLGVEGGVRVLADLAAEAEASGWDGVFIWDSVSSPDWNAAFSDAPETRAAMPPRRARRCSRSPTRARPGGSRACGRSSVTVTTDCTACDRGSQQDRPRPRRHVTRMRDVHAPGARQHAIAAPFRRRPLPRRRGDGCGIATGRAGAADVRWGPRIGPQRMSPRRVVAHLDERKSNARDPFTTR